MPATPQAVIIDRLPQVSKIASALIPGASFAVKQSHNCRTFYLCTSAAPPTRLILGGDGSRLSLLPSEMPHALSVREALAQSLRYLMGRRHRPLAWWALWFPSHVVAAVRLTGYGDRSDCVFCGYADPLDWYAVGRDDGPCCSSLQGTCKPVSLPIPLHSDRFDEI